MLLSIIRPTLLFLLLQWLLAVLPTAVAQLEQLQSVLKAAESARVAQFARSLSPKVVAEAVKIAPEKFKLGNTDFLGSGLRRKSLAGAYGSTAAVSVGAAAITYQTMNMQSRNRDMDRKQQSKSHYTDLSSTCKCTDQ